MNKKVLMEFLQKVDKDFTPYLSQKIDLSSFCDKMLANAKLFVSCSTNGEIKGLVALYANDFTKKYAYIPLLAVAPMFRKQGIARTLMDSALEYVRGLGTEKIQIIGIHTSNPIALSFYEKLGFGLVDESNNREYLELHL